MRTIGILGGMGPQATADIYMKIINIFQERFKAKYDSDFPQIIINSVPLPDIVENSINEDEIKNILIKNSILLEKAGTDFIIIPCNSVSKFIPDMRKAVNIPILSIIEETINKIKKNKIGILATQYTLYNKLYEIPLIEKGKQVILPNEYEKEKLTNIIMSILSNIHLEKARIELKSLIEKIKSRGAEEIILGCTELPLIADKESYLIDTLDILAARAVELAKEVQKETLIKLNGEVLS